MYIIVPAETCCDEPTPGDEANVFFAIICLDAEQAQTILNRMQAFANIPDSALFTCYWDDRPEWIEGDDWYPEGINVVDTYPVLQEGERAISVDCPIMMVDGNSVCWKAFTEDFGVGIKTSLVYASTIRQIVRRGKAQ